MASGHTEDALRRLVGRPRLWPSRQGPLSLVLDRGGPTLGLPNAQSGAGLPGQPPAASPSAPSGPQSGCPSYRVHSQALFRAATGPGSPADPGRELSHYLCDLGWP